MGYQISSILGVASDDLHSYFLYYIPSQGFEYRKCEWMNEYMAKNFTRIAQLVGPNAVFITPLDYNRREYYEKVNTIEGFFCRGEGRRRDILAICHSGRPFLIFSKTPLCENTSGDGIIIDLAGIQDEATLGAVLDAIIKTICSDSFEDFVNHLPELTPSEDRPDPMHLDLTTMLELKPNVFGLGVNLNAVIDYVSKKIMKNRESFER